MLCLRPSFDFCCVTYLLHNLVNIGRIFGFPYPLQYPCLFDYRFPVPCHKLYFSQHHHANYNESSPCQSMCHFLRHQCFDLSNASEHFYRVILKRCGWLKYISSLFLLMILRSPSPSLHISINCIRKTISSITFNPYALLNVKYIIQMEYVAFNPYIYIFPSEWY